MKLTHHLFIGGAGWGGEYHAGSTPQIPGYGCNLEAPYEETQDCRNHPWLSQTLTQNHSTYQRPRRCL